MNDSQPSHHHRSASPRAAALGVIVAMISIGVTLMAPQSFIVGIFLCWAGAFGIAYYYRPTFWLVLTHTYRREWNKYRTLPDDTWPTLALFLVVAILPFYFYLTRIPANTDVILSFSQKDNKKPGINLVNIGDVTAASVQYVGFYWNLDAAKQPDPNPVANALCGYIKARDRCGPLDILFNTTLSFPDNARIIGIATIDCVNCITRREFLVFTDWLHSGWFVEIDRSKGFNFDKFVDELPAIAKSTDAFVNSFPGQKIAFAKME
jgi:hypothetical protein